MSRSNPRPDSLQIVYFGNDWFAENRTSSHHVASRLADRFPLLYVDSPGLRAPRATGRDLGKVWRKVREAGRLPRKIGERQWHMTAPQIPFRRFGLVRGLNSWLGRHLVRRALRHIGFQRPVLWFVTPDMAALAGQLGERFVVYYCIDDYARLPDIHQQSVRQMDEHLVRAAHQVFVSSPALLEPKQRLNAHCQYSPHGVDVALFRKAADPSVPVAEQVRELPKPVIGFFGLLEAWVDLELLVYLATARPHWTLLLIGRVAVDAGPLARLPNVVLTGPQPYQRLPQWAKAFDVGIIPFRQCELVRSVNPLKLREYLAMGKPVVSVWMPEVERFASCVSIARTHEEFLARIEEELATDSEEKRKARMEAVAGMSWDARVSEVLSVVEERMREVEGAAGTAGRGTG